MGVGREWRHPFPKRNPWTKVRTLLPDEATFSKFRRFGRISSRQPLFGGNRGRLAPFEFPGLCNPRKRSVPDFGRLRFLIMKKLLTSPQGFQNAEAAIRGTGAEPV